MKRKEVTDKTTYKQFVKMCKSPDSSILWIVIYVNEKNKQKASEFYKKYEYELQWYHRDFFNAEWMPCFIIY